MFFQVAGEDEREWNKKIRGAFRYLHARKHTIEAGVSGTRKLRYTTFLSNQCDVKETTTARRGNRHRSTGVARAGLGRSEEGNTADFVQD